jgi:hypothetical protein
MEWLHLVSWFFGGAFLANAVPHFVSGMMGNAAWLCARGYPTVGFDASEELLALARRRHPEIQFGTAALPNLDPITPGKPARTAIGIGSKTHRLGTISRAIDWCI